MLFHLSNQRVVCRRFLSLATFVLLALIASAPLYAVSEAKTCAGEPAVTPLAYGDVYSIDCMISPVADLDQFEFVAAAGDTIRLVATDTNNFGGTDICIELLGPDPDLPMVACAEGAAAINEELTVPGAYTVLVTEQNNDSGLPYGLSLERISPVRNEWSALTFGIVEIDEINPVPDVDIRRLQATAGDLLRFSATDTNAFGGTDVCLEVIAPSGAVAVNPMCAETNVQWDLPVTETGEYAVIVYEANHDNTFPYSLNVECLSGNCDAKPPICDTALTYLDGTLTLDFLLRTQDPLGWSVYLTFYNQTFRIWQLGLPGLDPATPASVPIPNFPNIGEIGILSTFQTNADGLVCTDWETVDTGDPPPGPPAAEQIEGLLRQLRARGRAVTGP